MSTQTPIDVPLIDRSKEELVAIIERLKKEMRWYVDERNRLIAELRTPDGGKRDQGAKMRQDVFSLAEGEAVLSWPTPLSADSINDLKDWLKIVERKIVRSEKTAETSEEPTP